MSKTKTVQSIAETTNEEEIAWFYRPVIRNAGAVLVAIMVLAVYFTGRSIVMIHPINDVTTNPDVPVRFVETHPPFHSNIYWNGYAELSREAYPDLHDQRVHMVLGIKLEDVFHVMADACKELVKQRDVMGNKVLEINYIDPDSFKVQGLSTFPIFRWEADFVASVEQDGEYAVIGARSKMRLGRFDLGHNFRMVEAFQLSFERKWNQFILEKAKLN